MKQRFVYLILFVSSLTLSSCFSYKELELSDIKDVKLNRVNGKIEVQAGIHIKNPNNYKIKIKKIEADMLVNNNKVGKIQLVKKVVLPRKSDQVQNFTVNTELSNILGALPSVLLSREIKMQLKGHIRGKVFLFSRKFPLEAEEKISTKDLDLF